MKKLLLFASFIFFSLISAAQGIERKIGYGFQAGWSSSHISGSTFDSKSSFIGGLTASVSVSGNFYIQPEVNYQQLGGKYKGGTFVAGDIVYQYAELDVSYLNVPVLVKYRIVPTNLSIYAGPQIGFRLNAKTKLEDGNSFDLNNVKSTDFSGVYGLEYFIRLPEEKNVALVLNARYMSGFTNFAKYTYSNMPEESQRTKAIMIMLGLRF